MKQDKLVANGQYLMKRCGNFIGKITASFKASFAASNPATSLHFTFGFSTTIAPEGSWGYQLYLNYLGFQNKTMKGHIAIMVRQDRHGMLHIACGSGSMQQFTNK